MPAPRWEPAGDGQPLYGEGRSFTGLVQRVEESPEPDLTGKPLPALGVLEALRLYASGTSIQQAAKDTELSYRRARRVYSWVESGAVHWDVTQRKPIVAPGYRLVSPGKSRKTRKPTLQLIRF